MSHTLFVNPAAQPVLEVTDGEGPLPIDFHRLLPGYQRTPLLDCPAIAKRLGVARVLVKNESSRLGLPAFKMLGASWATAVAVSSQWLGLESTPVMTVEELKAAIPNRQQKALAAATDGNHGRGVARMAKLLGLGCTIYVPKGTAASRIADIESEGATVVVVDGTYDDAIAVSAKDAGPDTIVISDTSWEGYRQIPTAVGRGYSTLFREVDAALAEAGLGSPTHVAIQAGVGSFAAAALEHYRAAAGGPRTAIVEPSTANCLMASAEAGHIVEVPGPHESTMAGLNCGLPSQLAWPTIQHAADLFIAIGDEWSDAAMRLLAESGIVAGESGAASLGGLLSVVEDGSEAERASVALEPDSTVLLVNTEGATDPVNYLKVVGATPEQVAAEREARRKATAVIER